MSDSFIISYLDVGIPMWLNLPLEVLGISELLLSYQLFKIVEL